MYLSFFAFFGLHYVLVCVRKTISPFANHTSSLFFFLIIHLVLWGGESFVCSFFFFFEELFCTSFLFFLSPFYTKKKKEAKIQIRKTTSTSGVEGKEKRHIQTRCFFFFF